MTLYYVFIHILAIRDFNANTKGNVSRFGQELLCYCNNENLIISDSVLAPLDSFTFLSEAHGSVSRLDHIVSTNSLYTITDNIRIGYNYVSSNYFL